MPRKALLTRTALMDRLTPVFLDAGYEGASLSRLAAASGLAKATLYHHFPNGKTDMAASILARTGHRLQALVLDPLFDDALTPNDRLCESLDGVLEFYDGDVPACTLNTMLMGEGRPLFRDQVHKGLSSWADALDRSLAETEFTLSGTDLLDHIQGCLVRCKAVGSRQPLETLVARWKDALS